MLRKVVMSFHLVEGRWWRYKGQELGGDFLWNCGRGPTPPTSPSQELRYSLCFGPVSFVVSQRLSVSKWAEHKVWLLYSIFQAHETGMSIKRGAQQWQVQSRTRCISEVQAIIRCKIKKERKKENRNTDQEWRDLEKELQFIYSVSVTTLQNIHFYKD